MVNMVIVQRAEVPEFLHTSSFYQALNEDDDEHFLVPDKAIKANLEIHNTTDLHNVLLMLRFWCVSEVPDELVEYVLANQVTDYASTFEEFEHDLRYLSVLKEMKQCFPKERISLALKYGRLDIVMYLHTHGNVLTSKHCEVAALNGHFHCLKYLHERKCQWDHQTCIAAASSGHLECLKYAYSKGCPMNADTCAAAAAGGHLHCLTFAHTKSCRWNQDTCYNAAKNGHLECLKFAHESGCPWNTVTCTYAAIGGHLSCLQYARTNGCPWDTFTSQKAAQHGHYDCLKFAALGGCPIKEGDLLVYNKHCLNHFENSRNC